MADKEIIGLPGILELYGEDAVEFLKYHNRELTDAEKESLKEADEVYAYQSSKQSDTLQKK